jgi:tetratricopeptide (TPR) repeat protein
MDTLDHCKQQAMLALQGNRLDSAYQWLTKARDLSSNDTAVLQLSAQVCGQLGRMDEAAGHCEQLLAQDPGNATAWAFLGNTRMAAGDYPAALTAFNKAVSLSPGDAMVLTNRGSALFLLNRHQEAIECLERAIRLAPTNANAYFNLGRVYKTLGDFDKAATQLEQAIRHNPDLSDAHIHLAGVYFALGKLSDSERVSWNAVNSHPDDPYYRNSLVSLYVFTGDYDRALEQCDIILEHTPGDVTALGNKTNILERRGQYDEAFTLARELANSNRLDITGSEVYARLCQRYDACDDAIVYMEKMLEGTNLDEHRRSLHFNLGRIMDRLGRYEQAIGHYQTANRLAAVNYDFDNLVRQFEELREAFSAENLASMPRSDRDTNKPVFIVGMPRSGTSLTEQIIASHPDVYGAGELNALNELANSIPLSAGTHHDYPKCVTELDREQMNHLADVYLAQINAMAPDALRVTDKMPHNFRNLGLITCLFPGARIIHCIRDPRDTCLSIFFQSFNQTHAYGADLETLGKYYREYEKLMDHWRRVIDIPMYEIRYADLVGDQEKYSRELVEFCGLEWSESCLEFHVAGRDVATASYDQVRKPMYTSSLERWRHYEPWIQPLLEALEATS